MSNLYVDTVQPFSTGSRTTLVSASLQGLTNISSSQVLYYNTSSGEVYYDDAPTGGGGGTGVAGLISGSGVGSLISANYQPTASVATGTNSISVTFCKTFRKLASYWRELIKLSEALRRPPTSLISF